jgi:predicted alpha/beta hydrolase family esterase
MQVILVGHDLGGACISYVMELFPSKIAKAVFIAATMLSSGQSALDIFSQQVCPLFYTTTGKGTAYSMTLN